MKRNEDSETDHTTPFTGRRQFIVGVSTGIVAAGFYPFFPASADAYAMGFGSFLKRLAKFAAKVGLGALGIDSHSYLDNLNARIKKEVDKEVDSITKRGYALADTIFGDSSNVKSSIFVPMFNGKPGQNIDPMYAVVPFFDVAQNSRYLLNSRLPVPTMSVLPDVGEDLEKKFDENERYQLLVPYRPDQESFMNQNYPDQYGSRNGGTVKVKRLKGDEKAGDFEVKVTRKRSPDSDREQEVLKQVYEVEIPPVD